MYLHKKLRFASLGVLALLVLFTGCQKQKDAEAPVSTATNIEGGKKGKSQGGGVDDMAVYPAPSGVKTGIEGGKK